VRREAEVDTRIRDRAGIGGARFRYHVCPEWRSGRTLIVTDGGGTIQPRVDWLFVRYSSSSRSAGRLARAADRLHLAQALPSQIVAFEGSAHLEDRVLDV
jgi:hypothetical protein